jgi:hypothetical protein
MQVEFRGKSFFESRRAGVARVDERAVNVEENEPNHAWKISEHGIPARFLGRLLRKIFQTTCFRGSFQLRKGELHEKLESDLED